MLLATDPNSNASKATNPAFVLHWAALLIQCTYMLPALYACFGTHLKPASKALMIEQHESTHL
jgi:hypothetical protein